MEFPNLGSVDKQELYHHLNGKKGASKASRLAQALKGRAVGKKKSGQAQMSMRG